MINKKLLTCLLTASLLCGGVHARSVKAVLEAMLRFEPVQARQCSMTSDKEGFPRLVIEDAGITEFTEEDVEFLVARLPRLRSLRLERNGIRTLPSNIGRLEWLVHVGLFGNPLSKSEVDKAHELIPYTRITPYYM